MRRPLLIAVSWIVLVAVLTGLGPKAAGSPASDTARLTSSAPRLQHTAGDVVPGRFNVVFRDDVVSAQGVRGLSRDLGITVDRQYNHVVRGFSAKLTPDQVRALRQNVAVRFVEPDRYVEAHASLPTGVDRIGADSTANGAPPKGAGKPVAVLDTGVGPHPRVNLRGGHNCSDEGGPLNFGDGNGHGTHVAGTIGASGAVPGVAPNTPIFAVKVLGSNGSGSDSTVACGLDWVADNHDLYGIVAVNLSLGRFDSDSESATDCTSSLLHIAICKLADEQVTIVVSAGNDDIDARWAVPAKYDQVVTVAAMTDTDGCRGGRGPSSSWGTRDRDDRRWIWSNYGPALDVIAPGVDIVSTVPGGYASFSGTSMAAPHVTGAIARDWDPAGGPVERGIPGFLSTQGLVLLSDNTVCPVQAKPASITTPRKTVKPGGTLTLRITNFEPGERVRVTIGGRRLAVIIAKGKGAATKRATVPGAIKPGVYTIRAKGNAGGMDTVRIRVTKRRGPGKHQIPNRNRAQPRNR